ncbi:PrsW family glutamic-type intramembrane protease [Verrucomicrobium sp. BvORR034]|uniref:PrsW family glutamic-type intramembrane protease n=1 Tax=Verrucomicrobium sp. BvORR034 TaxID=1396418 RepID=UPI0006799898|nr:PrsW family glutamic-type intramembrane protease [Verrucomicrobium sp. BvORR034]
MPLPDNNSRPWRARAFFLTRNKRFLVQGVLLILGFFGVLAALTHVILQLDAKPVKAATAEEDEQIVEEFHRLEQIPNAQPSRFSAWVRSTAILLIGFEPADRPPFDPVALTFGDLHLEPVVRKHASSADAYPLFSAYVRCLFAAPGTDFRADRNLLVAAAQQRPALRHAGEFLGDFYYYGDSDPAKALPCYMQEVPYADAQYARRMALHVALQLDDVDALRQLASNPVVLSDASPTQLKNLAYKLKDPKIALRATAALQVSRWSYWPMVCLALFAAAIWYLILIQSGQLRPHRWARYLPAVLAGVLSVVLLNWLQIYNDYQPKPNPEDNPTKQLIHWILYVGIPEEGFKIAFFALFLPILLRQRSRKEAALTAGCVGLGFAFNENIAYFVDPGPHTAATRLLTANVLHFTLTGILGLHLYELFRSRFHSATNFIIAFLAVSAAHGMYNFSGSSVGLNWEIDIAHIIIVAVATKLYLQILHEDHEPAGSGSPISRTSVFWFGTSFIVGILMIVAVVLSGSLEGISATLAQAIAMVPVALIYQHEFNEMRR